MLFIFSTPMSIRHLWLLETVVFMHWCLTHVVLLYKTHFYFLSFEVKVSVTKMNICCIKFGLKFHQLNLRNNFGYSLKAVRYNLFTFPLIWGERRVLLKGANLIPGLLANFIFKM